MSKELKKDTLGLAQSLVMGVAGSAPSYSISATMATLVAAVGVLAPASLFYSGLLIVGVVLSYMYLNQHNPNSGASYAWVSEIFHVRLGFFAGWTLLVASALFMVAATIPAATATLLLLAPELVASQTAVTLCAAGWLALVTLVVVRGVGLTAKIQVLMTTCELAILFIISVLVLNKLGGQFLHQLNWHDLSLFAFTPESFARGAVISLFFFWGWDVSLNLNEETRSSNSSPGFGAVGAVLVILVFFTVFAAIILLALGDKEIADAGTNVIFVVADKVLPRPWGYIAVLAAMLSTVGTIETSMLQFTRTMFAKSRDGVFHARWSRTHDRWGTPHYATFLIGILGAAFLVGSLASEGLASVMSKSINIIGVQAAYYYGLAALACAWHFRKQALRSVSGFLMMMAWPVVSCLAMWWAACVTALSFDLVTAAIAVGSVLLGFVPLVIHARQK